MLVDHLLMVYHLMVQHHGTVQHHRTTQYLLTHLPSHFLLIYPENIEVRDC
jgi:hypothetical protein